MILLTGHRVKARPVVPIRVRGRIVRVDVARAIIATVIDVSTPTDSPDHVGINEVGVKTGRPHESALQSQIWKDYSRLFLFPLEIGRLLRISYGNFKRKIQAAFAALLKGACGPLCRLRGIHPYWAKKRPDPKYQFACEVALYAMTERGPALRPSAT